MSVPRSGIELLAWLGDLAFDGDPHQSLLASVRRLRDDDWYQLPPGGGRSTAAILEHVAWAKWMYQDYAFGPGTLRGDRPPLWLGPEAPPRPRDELLPWLEEGHRRWTASVRGLPDDAELERPRLTNWGERLPTRTLIQILLAHDHYHAGEINHLRALLQGDDRWRYG